MNKPELSIILPCRNEEASLGDCLQAITAILKQNMINGEIIVADSSTDRSPTIAAAHGVQVVAHGQVGYGLALQAGFQAASGTYLLCVDADMTYDFADIPLLLNQLRDGADLVIGIRRQQSAVSPWLHAYIGVPLTAWLIAILFRGDIKDPHCGLRAISRQAYDQLRLRSAGMEFASEMIVRALQHNLRIAQLPTAYFARRGESKLRPWADGFRHLTLLLRLRLGLKKHDESRDST